MKDTNKVAIPVIQNDKGEYLLITRSEYPEHKGEWGPVAGHVKENETLEEALIRETKEELGLDITPVKQIVSLPQDIKDDVGFWWLCKANGNNIVPNNEIEEYKYFAPGDIKNLKLWPATKKFFENFVWQKIWNLKFSSLNSPDDILKLIESGEKTIETRSRNPNDQENDYTNIKGGDILHFVSTDTSKTIDKVVVFNHVYGSISEMVKAEDVEKILPGIGSKENMEIQFELAKQKWGEKYKFELENYGIVVIGFK